MKKIICIDPGHGGKDSGAILGSRYEKADTLALALKVRQHLERCGFTVYLTRDKDITVDLNNRPKYANGVKADYFLSLHRNSFNSTSTGIEGWIYSKANADTQSKAEAIYNRVISVAKVTSRGIKKGYTGKPTSDYAVNRYSNMPSMLLELLFISNVSDNTIYDKHLNDYAIAICKGFCDMYGVKYIEIPTATNVIYKVQVGAYKEKANAEKLLNELKSKGYNGYITN